MTTTGYICKTCGEPSPIGVGYKSNDPAVVNPPFCRCGTSAKWPQVNDLVTSTRNKWFGTAIVMDVSGGGCFMKVRSLHDFTEYDNVPVLDITYVVIDGDDVFTHVEYMYRDASNYKRFHTARFAGALRAGQLEALLAKTGEPHWFLPEAVGLPNPRDQFESVYEDDGSLCELDGIEIVAGSSKPGLESIGDFTARFVAAEFTPEAAAASLAAFAAGRPPGGGVDDE